MRTDPENTGLSWPPCNKQLGKNTKEHPRSSMQMEKLPWLLRWLLHTAVETPVDIRQTMIHQHGSSCLQAKAGYGAAGLSSDTSWKNNSWGKMILNVWLKKYLKNTYTLLGVVVCAYNPWAITIFFNQIFTIPLWFALFPGYNLITWRWDLFYVKGPKTQA